MDGGDVLSFFFFFFFFGTVCRVYKLGPLLSQWSPTMPESLFKRYTLWISTIFSSLSIRHNPFESMAMAPTVGGETSTKVQTPLISFSSTMTTGMASPEIHELLGQ